MDKMKWRTDIEQLEIPIYSFSGYLLFAKGDKRLRNTAVKVQEDRAFDYLMSIGSRITIIDICHKEILKQAEDVKQERNELELRGHVKGTQSIMMVMRYYNFMNAIYSLMENIAFIVRAIYRKKNLPNNFHEQKKRILKNPEIEPTYSKLLQGLSWYDEVERIRSEYTHFLTGMIISNTSGVIEYVNKPLSNRKTAIGKIARDDIIKHVSYVREELGRFLDELGKHLIDTMDKDVRIATICGITAGGLLGVRLQSFNEMTGGKPGICKSYKFDCPDADTCATRKNTDLATGLEVS